MTPTTTPIVQQVKQEFETLVQYVTGPDTANAIVTDVEVTLFRRLLALGASLLQLFFLTRAATRPPAPLGDTGIVLPYHDQRSTSYFSVFGKLCFRRHAFWAPGQALVCPLDAALSLPKRCYSDLLREWASFGVSDAAYRENQALLERLLGVKLSVQALERETETAATDVDAFYAQAHAIDASASTARILVVQADGKGVPMVEAPGKPKVERRSRGHKRFKKEAVVTALYTVEPYVRSAEDVVRALLREPTRVDVPDRPEPSGKEVRATLAGKSVALERLAARTAQRETACIQHRVALTDGAEGFQNQLQAHFPRHTLVLDIIHVSEYLCEAANTLFGDTNPERTVWVRRHLLALLRGQTAQVIEALEAEAALAERKDVQRHYLTRALKYYRRNQPFMHYDEYLAKGWPIGTGVVEGACGHLVKDRMEQAGMCWRQAGAQAVLDLRAVRLNGDWDTYWQFHRRHEHHRLYGDVVPAVQPDAQVLQMAA